MIDDDDLALLATSFLAALTAAPDHAFADRAMFELGWSELLAEAPVRGAAIAFAAIGATGATAGLLDDVVANALGVPVGPDVCVVLPAPGRATAAGVLRDGRLAINGIVSGRLDSATRVLVPLAAMHAVAMVDGSLLPLRHAESLDSAAPYRRVVATDVPAVGTIEIVGSWDGAVSHARCALAAQLVAASRVSLETARRHAIDRVQFQKPIASFQAIRHKLAETLVAIEGAAAATNACRDDGDPLLGAIAKSLAGRAAHITNTHAQQVLAGIGFTTDHPFHRSLKRTLVLDTLFGSARTLPTEIGLTLLAQRDAPRLVEL